MSNGAEAKLYATWKKASLSGSHHLVTHTMQIIPQRSGCQSGSNCLGHAESPLETNLKDRSLFSRLLSVPLSSRKSMWQAGNISPQHIISPNIPKTPWFLWVQKPGTGSTGCTPNLLGADLIQAASCVTVTAAVSMTSTVAADAGAA